MNCTINYNGRELHTYEISNKALADIVENKLAEGEQYDSALKSLIARFKTDCVPNNGESEDELFASVFGNFVNGKLREKRKVAEKMAREHRYLQNEMFKVCLEYIKVLAENARKGYYDPRNEWACKTSKVIIEHLNDINYFI